MRLTLLSLVLKVQFDGLPDQIADGPVFLPADFLERTIVLVIDAYLSWSHVVKCSVSYGIRQAQNLLCGRDLPAADRAALGDINVVQWIRFETHAAPYPSSSGCTTYRSCSGAVM